MATTRPAPIALFVYNRLAHTKQTIEALLRNELAEESDLTIFSDAPKNASAERSVQEVRKYIKSIEGFRSVSIIERNDNWGLAKSIIEGVTRILKEREKIIVLEDDIITSPAFLRFMNEALELYENQKKVWHISGWNYPISTKDIDETFLWRCMNCWGWATWADRWSHFEKAPSSMIELWKKEEIFSFNLDGAHNFWSQVLNNQRGRTNTWAIFWYATIFKNNGLCLNPSQSLTKNIGNDGSGINCSDYDPFSGAHTRQTVPILTDAISENDVALRSIQAFYRENKPSFFDRASGRLKKILRNLYQNRVAK
ncbi:hypothetical protein [Thauera sp. WH-1]|uniref:hypothetical protein n=1 Tax=Thauera sp. WH-1 TaxID=3398230 RepID=UPI0039FD3707